jgi:hypothetical protein
MMSVKRLLKIIESNSNTDSGKAAAARLRRFGIGIAFPELPKRGEFF